MRVSGNDEPFIYFLLSLHVLEGMAQRLRGMTIFPEIRVRIPVPPIIYFLLSGECEIVRQLDVRRSDLGRMECEVGGAGRQADGSNLQ